MVEGRDRMAHRLRIGLLPALLAVLIGGCADQSAFAPTAVDDSSLSARETDIVKQAGKRGPGGGAAGLKKDH
jgi:hypothetical protein